MMMIVMRMYQSSCCGRVRPASVLLRLSHRGCLYQAAACQGLLVAWWFSIGRHDLESSSCILAGEGAGAEGPRTIEEPMGL